MFIFKRILKVMVPMILVLVFQLQSVVAANSTPEIYGIQTSNLVPDNQARLVLGSVPAGVSIVDETDLGFGNAVNVTDFSVYFSGPATNYSLGLSGNGLSSGLYALGAGGQGSEILLFLNSGQVQGLVMPGGDVYFTLAANSATGEVEFRLFKSVWSDDVNDQDESMALQTLSINDLFLSANTSRSAVKGGTETLDLGQGAFVIRDDGPDSGSPASITDLPFNDFQNIQLLVDESPGQQPNPVDNVADRVSRTDFTDLFGGIIPIDYGEDGPGTLSYDLSLTDGFGAPPFGGLASGLYALDNTDVTFADGDGIGQGEEILLFETSGVIEGRTGSDLNFSISNTGTEVTLAQFTNLWHPDTSDNNDVMALTGLDGSGTAPYAINLVQTIFDADGDSVLAALELTEEHNDGYVFSFYDAGVSAGNGLTIGDLTGAEFDALQLRVDESLGAQPDPVDNVADRTSNADFGSVINGIDPIDYGTDGPGSVVYGLSLTDGFGSPPFGGLASGVFALDDTDVITMDGDGIGQGNEILLFEASGVIEGRVGSDVYFSITNNGTEVTLTQVDNLNLWHPDTANSDDAMALTGLDGSGTAFYAINLVQTVVDADGDSISTALDLTEQNINGYIFTFYDAGVSVDGVLSFGSLTDIEFDSLQLSVDESVGQQANPEDTVADRVSSADYANVFSLSAVNTSGSLAVNLGTDGPGGFDFTTAALRLTDASGIPIVVGANSGLFGLVESPPGSGNFIQGNEIQLFPNAGTIEGRADGVVYFVISNIGAQVTLTQSAGVNLWHPDDTDVDDEVSLNGMADGSPVVTYQILLETAVLDADGDEASIALMLSEALDVDGSARYVFNFADTADDDDDPPANSAPVVIDDVYTAFEDITLVVDDPDGSVPGLNDNGVLVNDSDADDDSLSVDNPGIYTMTGLGGEVTLAADGTFDYVPPADVSGQDVLSIDVTDGLAVVSSTLTIDVLPVNDPPSFSILGDVLNADLDPDFLNNSLTIVAYAFNILPGPVDESGQSLQFIPAVTADDDAILVFDGVSVNSSGDLTLDFTGNIGSATVQLYLEDNGGTTNGGDDTSPVVVFEVSVFDLIFRDGYEAP